MRTRRGEEIKKTINKTTQQGGTCSREARDTKSGREERSPRYSPHIESTGLLCLLTSFVVRFFLLLSFLRLYVCAHVRPNASELDTLSHSLDDTCVGHLSVPQARSTQPPSTIVSTLYTRENKSPSFRTMTLRPQYNSPFCIVAEYLFFVCLTSFVLAHVF